MEWLQATPRNRDHTLPVMPPDTLQEEGSYVTLDRLEKLMRPFAMPAEDFPPASNPQGFSGLFMKGGGVLDCLVKFWIVLLSSGFITKPQSGIKNLKLSHKNVRSVDIVESFHNAELVCHCRTLEK